MKKALAILLPLSFVLPVMASSQTLSYELRISEHPVSNAEAADLDVKIFNTDSYSFHILLGAIVQGIEKCLSVHLAGMNDNTVLFDGITELLDAFTNGEQPFIFEFETPSNSTSEINAVSGSDLFPKGFEDPETGTPLTAACIEIGLDDPLDSDEPTKVSSAAIDFDGDVFDPAPIDITSSFSDPWDGTLRMFFDGFVGQGLNTIRLTLETEPSKTLFADGFESGGTSSWTASVP